MPKYALVWLSALLVTAMLVIGGCGTQAVATVNGVEITSAELDSELGLVKISYESQGYVFDGEQAKEFEEMLRPQVLEQLISDRLIITEVERLDLMPTEKEINDALTSIKEQQGSEAEFVKYLTAIGMNEPKLKDYLKRQMAYSKLADHINAGVPASTEQEIADFFAQNSAQYATADQRQVSHILIGVGDSSDGANRSDLDAKTLALQIVNKLDAGEDFATLAQEYTDDPGSKDTGGQYPAFSRGSGFVAEFEDAAFALTQRGEYTHEPVKTQYGYHILLLDDIIPSSNPTLEEVKEQVTQDLRQQQLNQKQSEYMQELRLNADVVNNLETQQEETPPVEETPKQPVE